MPRPEPRRRVERGLYRSGSTFTACASPPGSRKARWKTLTATTLTAARRQRDEFAVAVHGGAAVTVDPHARLATVAALWLAEQKTRVRPRTYESYETVIRLHLGDLGAVRISVIRAEHLIRWHDAQAGSQATIHQHWRTLRTLLAWATRRGYVAADPTLTLDPQDRPKPGEPRVRILDPTEIERLLAHAAERYRLAFGLALFCGLRISEVLALRWQDVDLTQRIVHVNAQMTRKGHERVPLKTRAGRRDVVLMTRLAAQLRRRRVAARFSRDSDFVFATEHGTPPGERILSRSLQRTCTRAKLEGVSMHTLRHTYASLLISKGRDPVYVADQMGHADVTMIWRVYGHLFAKARHAAATRDALDAEFGSALDSRLTPSAAR